MVRNLNYTNRWLVWSQWLIWQVHSIYWKWHETFMISRPTLSCFQWWEFVYTNTCHDVICTSIANAIRRNIIFISYCSGRTNKWVACEDDRELIKCPFVRGIGKRITIISAVFGRPVSNTLKHFGASLYSL